MESGGRKGNSIFSPLFIKEIRSCLSDDKIMLNFQKVVNLIWGETELFSVWPSYVRRLAFLISHVHGRTLCRVAAVLSFWERLGLENDFKNCKI